MDSNRGPVQAASRFDKGDLVKWASRWAHLTRFSLSKPRFPALAVRNPFEMKRFDKGDLVKPLANSGPFDKENLVKLIIPAI